MQIVTDEGKDRVLLTEPTDWRFAYDPQIVLREALHRSGGGSPRLPEVVAAFPPEWERDIGLMLKLLKFQRDGEE